MAQTGVNARKAGESIATSLAGISKALELLWAKYDMADLGRRLELGITSFTRLTELMAPLGWIISLRYTPRRCHELLKLHETDGPAAVANGLLNDFRAVSAREAVKDRAFADLPVLSDSLSALRMAAEAHDRGEYPLSIPIWLIATERVARQSPGIKPYSVQSSSGEVARTAAKDLAPSGSIAPPAARALMTVLTGLGGFGQPTVLNRHEVLHGTRPIAGTETESVQCFLALQIIAHLAGRKASRRSKMAASA